MDIDKLQNWFESLSSVLPHVNQDANVELDTPIETTSGGGMIRLVIGVDGTIKKLDIDPLLLERDNRGHLEQLIIGAANAAFTQYQAAIKKKMISTVLEKLPKDLDLGRAMAELLKPRNR